MCVLLTMLVNGAARPFLELVLDPERFRAWLQGFGAASYLVMALCVAAKVVLPMLPGKAFEIAAGYAFGAAQGSALVLLGTAVGTSIVLMLVKKCGVRLVRRFVSQEQLGSFPIWKDEGRFTLLCLIVYLIPGTPKDALTYAAALAPVSAWKLILVTTLARIPTVLAGVLGGDALGSRNYGLAALVLGVTLLLSGAALLVFRLLQKRKGKSGSNGATGPGEDDDPAAGR